MTRATHSSEKIEEALQLLQEAATEKKDELKGLLAGKYASLRDAVLDAEGELAEKVEELTRKADHVRIAAEKKARKLASQVDDKVHEDPWRIIGWTTVTALLVGYLIGNRKS
jgi:ElaB/YqjD/DUF883 family membrane-anchored ribosome-binding protein